LVPEGLFGRRQLLAAVETETARAHRPRAGATPRAARTRDRGRPRWSPRTEHLSDQ
jgi:hypothetical protein